MKDFGIAVIKFKLDDSITVIEQQKQNAISGMLNFETADEFQNEQIKKYINMCVEQSIHLAKLNTDEIWTSGCQYFSNDVKISDVYQFKTLVLIGK